MLNKTVCELFAGVGGFRVGLERASKEWKTVWANQWEPGRKLQHAFDCYCAHFGNIPTHVNIDISEIDKTTIPDHNLLVGGFPCQDYSVAHSLNSSKGIEGKKGVLWWQIRDTIEAKEPKFILLENVDRLLKSPASQRGRDFGIMLACMSQLGYSVEWRVINAAEYGFAQRRRRTFLFACKNTTTYAAIHEDEGAKEIINKSGFFAQTFPIEEISALNSTQFATDDLAELSDTFHYAFENSGYMTNGTIYTTKVIPILEYPILLKQIMEHDVDEKYYLGKNLDKWEYMKGAKKIERTAKSGHKYTFSEGPIAFPDPSDKPARTMLTSESTSNRSTHVLKDLDTGKLRLLTPIEAERIQGFPDNWTNTGMPERFRFFCMGNALVVGLVERMGKTLNRIFEEEDIR